MNRILFVEGGTAALEAMQAQPLDFIVALPERAWLEAPGVLDEVSAGKARGRDRAS